jgi:pantoate--beta-alanine ligase
LQEVERRVKQGERDAARLVQNVKERIAATPGAVVDYVEAVDAKTLHPVATISGPTLVALAVFFGTTRLIDNVVVGN